MHNKYIDKGTTMKIFIKWIIFISIFTNMLIADELDLDNLLQDIEKKTDLSEKTKLANAGVVTVYTRDDIQRMQIKTLTDVLKSLYPVGYNENKRGIVDPFAYSSNHLFVGSQIKLYIDNQEITNALYGSGLLAMGDINLQWVDHIEVYTQSPTYEYATESTVTLIKLYTKSVAKDEGGKVELDSSSYGAKSFNGYYSSYIGDWSYFEFLSYSDANRKTYDSFGTNLSKDSNKKAMITTLNKDNQNILLFASTEARDSFMDVSIDGTPTTALMDGTHIHLGYDNKIGKFAYLFSYDYTTIYSLMNDNVMPKPMMPFDGYMPISHKESDTVSNVFTSEVKYKTKIDNHNVITGIKYRLKKYKYDIATVNSHILTFPNDTQSVLTTFIEDQYTIDKSSILTLGVQYSSVRNNNSVQDDDMLLYRVGYTKTNEHFTFKTIASHTVMTLEPYLVNSEMFLAYPDEHYDPKELDTILEDIIYEKDNNKYELMVDYNRIKNHLVPDLKKLGKSVIYDKNLYMKGAIFEWTHHYNRYNKFALKMAVRQSENLIMSDDVKFYTINLKNVHSVGKYDIYNELLYERDSLRGENFYDYSLGIRYNYSDDIVISVKGYNLLDKAKTTLYQRVDPVKFKPEEPLEVSPIDRRITLTVEWTF